MKGGGKMADAQQINDFLVDAFGRINKIEERAMTTGLGSAISITEIDMFSGALMRMGKELGIPTPYNEYTYHMIKALEEKNDGRFAYTGEEEPTWSK